MSNIKELSAFLKERNISYSGFKKQELLDRVNFAKKYEYHAGYKTFVLINTQTRTGKVAAYDLDHTLIRPTTGKPQCEGVDDWEFCPQTVEHFKQHRNQGYLPVIITNQRNKPSRYITLQRIYNLVEQLGECVLIVCTDRQLSKPNPIIWSHLEKLTQTVVDKERSFYCGDAAGWLGDFSDTDRLFAEEGGVKYIRPLEKTVPLVLDERKQHEVVILVGMQGSGKTTAAKKFFPNYTLISNDEGTKLTATMLKPHDRNFVIDNTHPTVNSRENVIRLAKEHNYDVRCVWFRVDKECCLRRIDGREKNKVPEKALDIYKAQLQDPSFDEGIDEIVYL